MTLRGQQSDDFLKLSHDRKVSPQGIYQESRDRWIATIPNSFGLPAGLSCPGKTPFCDSCYAVGSEQSKGVRELVMHNARLLTEAGTVDAMANLLEEMVGRYLEEADRRGLSPKERIFRIHWDGDFFSLDYAAAWARVIHDTPDVQFWAYTRSFVEPVNVVPVLTGIPNLVLYLSADQWNVDAAREVVAEYPEVLLAYCTLDYKAGRELAQDRPVVVCPENSGRMKLMEDGVGACVSCALCPEGRKDVIFSTSHKEDAAAPVVRVTNSIQFAAGECQNPACSNLIKRLPGRGRPPKYCSDRCRWAMRNAQKIARPSLVSTRNEEKSDATEPVLHDIRCVYCKNVFRRGPKVLSAACRPCLEARQNEHRKDSDLEDYLNDLRSHLERKTLKRPPVLGLARL
jgi:hypothetical protein